MVNTHSELNEILAIVRHARLTIKQFLDGSFATDGIFFLERCRTAVNDLDTIPNLIAQLNGNPKQGRGYMGHNRFTPKKYLNKQLHYRSQKRKQRCRLG